MSGDLSEVPSQLTGGRMCGAVRYTISDMPIAPAFEDNPPVVRVCSTAPGFWLRALLKGVLYDADIQIEIRRQLR